MCSGRDALNRPPALPASSARFPRLGWFGPAVFDVIGIEPHPLHFDAGTPIVLHIHRVVQQELSPALRPVNLDRQDSRWPDQDTVLTLFGHYEGTLLDTEAAAKFRGQHHGPAPAHLAGQCFHHMPE